MPEQKIIRVDINEYGDCLWVKAWYKWGESPDDEPDFYDFDFCFDPQKAMRFERYEADLFEKAIYAVLDHVTVRLIDAEEYLKR